MEGVGELQSLPHLTSVTRSAALCGAVVQLGDCGDLSSEVFYQWLPLLPPDSDPGRQTCKPCLTIFDNVVQHSF